MPGGPDVLAWELDRLALEESLHQLDERSAWTADKSSTAESSKVGLILKEMKISKHQRFEGFPSPNFRWALQQSAINDAYIWKHA